jgi:hypothetical protein
MTTYRKSFNDYLSEGRIGEGKIAQWLRRVKNEILLPAYEIEIHSGKGPRLLLKDFQLVAPDFYAISIEGTTVLCKWREAKQKTRFTWHWVSKNWQTGIDLRHYEDYLKVRELTQTMVYIMFLHRGNVPSNKDLQNGSPVTCPTGLYCRSIDYLRAHEHHRDSYDKYGHSYPMVYWNEKTLGPTIATLEEVENAISSPSALAKTIRAKLETTLQHIETIDSIPDDEDDLFALERGMQEAERLLSRNWHEGIVDEYDRSSLIMANDDEEQAL